MCCVLSMCSTHTLSTHGYLLTVSIEQIWHQTHSQLAERNLYFTAVIITDTKSFRHYENCDLERKKTPHTKMFHLREHQEGSENVCSFAVSDHLELPYIHY